MTVNKACPNCKSTQVSIDAACVWDVESQLWIITDFHGAYCSNCDYEGEEWDLIEVEVKSA